MKPFYLFIMRAAFLAIIVSGCAGEPTAAPQTNPEPVSEQNAQPVEVEATTEEGMLPKVDPLAVTGDIVMAGSSTVFPLAEAMAERFENEGFAGKITIDSIGSGAGFERFCVAAESDISNASRAIKDSERESCKSIGRDPIEFRIGTDALAIVVSAENDFVEHLTLEQLAQIFSGDASTWADLDATWPTEPIQLFSPGSDSGTFDYFVEEIFDEDETVLVQGVLGSPFAIGYFGYAYYVENAGALKILSIEAVEPNQDNVDNGTYPLARPLFIYSDAGIMQEKPQVASFINFFLTNVGEEISDVGYFPAPDATIMTAKQAWLNAQGQ
jgi:phosphate transport system substrate-binding protein